MFLKNNHVQTCSKHIELDTFFVREEVLKKRLVVHNITCQDHNVDIPTKAASSQRFTTVTTSRCLIPKSDVGMLQYVKI